MTAECPRAETERTPCAARDGRISVTVENHAAHCAGCYRDPAELLRELVHERRGGDGHDI